MKYTDIISLQEYFHPVFYLQNEVDGYWKQFVPTEQFYTLLSKTLDAIGSNGQANRRSIWVQGTFGTGKSHASAVVKHLMCDDYTKIEGYISDRLQENANLKNRLIAIRNEKRFFPIVLTGTEGAYDVRTFSLILQRTIKESLKKSGNPITVNSDFEEAIDYLKTNTVIDFERIISQEDELRVLAKNKDALIKRLQSNDTDTYIAMEKVFSKSEYHIQITTKNITQWLSEVEKAIIEQGIANGLFIFWDEFTSVMDTINSGLIDTIQNIAHLSEQQNIYLFLISHRHSFQYSDKAEDVKRMMDRFHWIDYKMETITTYRIMSETIKKSDNEKYNDLRDVRMAKHCDLIDYLTDNESQQTENDIKNLFPIHPYSSYLCTAIANNLGSTNRSIFKFMYGKDGNGFMQFIEDDTIWRNNELLTADYLWDYFLNEFAKDTGKYGMVTERFHTNKKIIEQKGKEYDKVFKGILLLNAMKNTFDNERVIPSETNIKKIFESEYYENQLDEILDYFNQQQIVQKDPSNIFLIANSSLPPTAINAEKKKKEIEFSDVEKILSYDPSFRDTINKWFSDNLLRVCETMFFPCSIDEFRLKNRLDQFQKPDKYKSYSLHIALFFAMDDIQRQNVIPFIEKFKNDYPNIVFIVFNAVLNYDQIQYNRFVDYAATQTVAINHNSKELAEVNRKNAIDTINNWIIRIKQNPFQLYFRNINDTATTINVAKYINDNIGHKIFSSSAEIMQILRNKPDSFWKQQNSKTAAEAMLDAYDREDAIKKFTGQYTPGKFLFKTDTDDDVVNFDLTIKETAFENHPLVLVQKKVDEILGKVRKKYSGTFNLGFELMILTEPPFGLYANTPNIALLAFALRKYKSEFYTEGIGAPLEINALRDMVIDIFNYWQNGKNENKLKIRFGSKEEKELKDKLITIFELQKIPNLELTSITNVRWGIAYWSKNDVKYPLWALKYSSETNDTLNTLIDGIVELIQREDAKPETIKKLLKLLENDFEFRLKIRNQELFMNGFRKFICQVESVSIQEDWWDELFDYLHKRLQSEIGYWKESDVELKIKDFYIQKMQPVEPIPPIPTLPSVPVQKEGDQPKEEEEEKSKPVVHTEKLNHVRNKITQANIPITSYKWILVRILDKFPETADIINENID